jgi:serine protease Do
MILPKWNLLPGTLAILLCVTTAAAGKDQSTVNASGDDLSDAARAAIDAAIRKVYPALVRIHVVCAEYAHGREVKSEAFGSGVVISPEGYVITNHHVAGKAKRLRCTMSNKEEFEASLVGTDPLADIAVIKLHRKAGAGSAPLTAASFGDSEHLRVGNRVLAMGCPLALSQSVTLGIVSNLEMTLPREFGTFVLDGEEVGELVKWIGHDAGIFHGNSGGPLVNLKGEIIGINEIGYGLGGAIPGNLARQTADELIRNGCIKRSWLGWSVQPLLKSSNAPRGVLVAGVLPGSPAAKAGLVAGDVLLDYNGHPLDVHHSEQLMGFNRLVLETPIGATAKVSYQRGGEVRHAALATVARGNVEGHKSELKNWGITSEDLTLLSAKELQREPYSGVAVSSVRVGGPAAEAKPALEENDIITEVDGKKVHTIEELSGATTAVLKEKHAPAPILVAFERHGEHLLTVARIGEKETLDHSKEASKAWIPTGMQALTPELAEALGLGDKKGVRLTQVYPDSTASKAGLRIGDVLVSFDGEAIDVAQPEDIETFTSQVRRYAVGSKVKLEIVRDRKPMSLELELASAPQVTRQAVGYHSPSFEFRARNIAFQDRIQLELPGSQTGALITDVDQGGWAALAHLATNDIVLSVDGHAVQTVNDLRERMREVTRKKPEGVVFFVRRGVHTLFVELEPDWGAK